MKKLSLLSVLREIEQKPMIGPDSDPNDESVYSRLKMRSRPTDEESNEPMYDYEEEGDDQMVNSRNGGLVNAAPVPTEPGPLGAKMRQKAEKVWKPRGQKDPSTIGPGNQPFVAPNRQGNWEYSQIPNQPDYDSELENFSRQMEQDENAVQSARRPLSTMPAKQQSQKLRKLEPTQQINIKK